MIYFIADTHFSEDSIRMYENRPFENIAEMDQELIARWNERVQDSPLFKTYSDRHYCVSVERIDYTPVSFDDIMLAIQGKEK